MKAICLALLNAETEAEVDALVAATPIMTDGANWRPLDGRETNFNVTSNQASDGGKALTELMTNMVDAVLLKHAYLKGIDPKGSNAPRTMYEAVDRLIRNLRGGKLVNLDPRDPWLRDFAQKNLVIGIAGAKSKSEGLPSYTFVDNGEGQHPDLFETTFLSLSAGNKKSIRFVQGKFNMGSSGVLRYCGRKWYKLIVSRRFDGSGPWGWTLVRRRPGDRDAMPIAEYFVVPDGTIPRFESEFLYPLGLNDGRRYEGVHLSTGTVIKLYDYQVGSRFLSFKGSRDALNENLVETILPFRILDLRQRPDPKRGGDRALGVDPRPFYGMEFLLLNSHGDDGGEDDGEAAGTGHVFVGRLTDPVLGEVSIGAIALKRDLPGWLRPQNSNNRVFHTVNGQVQFKQSRGYLSQTCGFPALKDRVVVVVDASALRFAAHNEVWKGDREHISSTLDGERYLDMVTRTIRESEALKDFQKRVAAEELDRAARTEGDSLFQKLLDRDPTLAGLLSSRDPTIRVAGGGQVDLAMVTPYEGLYSPTLLQLEERYVAGLDVPAGRGRALAAKTNAENGYLQRADNQGSLIMDQAIRERFTVREHLKDGRLSVHFVPANDVTAGDTFEVKIGLFDRGMPEAIFTAVTTLRVVAAQEDDEAGLPAPKKEPKPKQSSDGTDNATHGMPRFLLLTRDGREIDGSPTERWPDGYNEHDGADVVDLGDRETLYKINYDNAYHLRYRMSQRTQLAREVVTEKFILGMRILLLGYEHAVRSLRKHSEQSEIGEFLDEFRRMAARGAASTVLALAENLPKIVDTSSLTSEDAE
ncbi:hypothetical protein EN741_01930 [Mesorhizobium sp. M4B.F.Ca.ET.019.03.1.1]|uniref:hypothetical protein n=2 Tax=unclassified Mesorhizobium TaxID=325217 RepID=UPI000FCA7605|nr:hypothetical protein [Mesorhizobium sp. M4B.F.Ca.ET.019.03.1.1]RVD46253.1 hypothetical protein EN741_01930 [Mesorhizobium sp. M4B.F.Ca.ET.019.03.1.1]